MTTTTCGLLYGCIFLLAVHGVLVWTSPKLTGPAGAAAGLPSTGHMPDELLVSNQLQYQRQTTTGDTVYMVSDDTAAVILRVRPAKSVEWRQS
ncbi:MAG TPA: hypothetical protein VN306_18940 [Mycobacterium sp.]|nr:hypothetical protein [Mycobacterium sp.]